MEKAGFIKDIRQNEWTLLKGNGALAAIVVGAENVKGIKKKGEMNKASFKGNTQDRGILETKVRVLKGDSGR